jgi:UDP-N-acetylmuramoyl-tripeptide--D-alanyl-D-alanine ligase
VVGVTGSTGKTTTKDLLAAVLSRVLRVVATQGNMNNEIGAPLTMMRAGVETEAVVVEMAMRGEGQIAELCAMARPTVGLVTNVGETHMELLGSREAIARAKGELVAAVSAGGAVFLNGDDAWSEQLAERSQAPVTTYGLGEGCDVRACDVIVDEEGRPSFALDTPVGRAEATLSVPGRHNAYNAAAAAAVALHLGVSLDDVVEGLREARLSPMRMESFTSADGVTVINDAYNASPTSMRAALAALVDISVSGRHVAVLGDMAELGSLTELAHFKLGEEVGRSDVDVLVTIGEKAEHIADGARTTGLDEAAIHRFGDAEDAAPFVHELVTPSDAVLVKASRVMGLERIVEGLMGTSCSS